MTPIGMPKGSLIKRDFNHGAQTRTAPPAPSPVAVFRARPQPPGSMFPAALLPLLAQAPPVAMDAATQNQALVFLGGAAALSFLANQIMGAVLNFRKLKGADPLDDKRYASKAEHDALKGEVIGLKSEMSGLSRTITNEFSSLNRSIGVLEGMLKAMAKQTD